MNFSTGSLVKARGREWVILPGSDESLLLLRPLGGSDEEIAGVYLPLEKVESASFDLPDPKLTGDHLSCKMLRNAVRLCSRSSAGPFRSFSKLGFEPRPYQLVPLIMALKLDPVRLLIADDVGIGKTIEACLIGKELLDRGEIQRIAILCPPHLAEQWQTELYVKFHMEFELVLSSTVSKLESRCALGQSLFDIYPHVIVSMDFIKSDRRREEFARSCPEFVIIDEAHSCAFGIESRGGRHQRHQLVKKLAENPDRHMVLVTATPHSGKEDAFRSLLSLLKSDFSKLPPDLAGAENEKHRRILASHFIQRRRGDIIHFMKSETVFPDREEKEETYHLSHEYGDFFKKVLNFTREIVKEEGGNEYKKRIRWWSALALLRSVGSSPAAAEQTLRNRSAALSAESLEEINEIGKRSVFDIDSDDLFETTDVTPGSNTEADASEKSDTGKKLLKMADEAKKLCGPKDQKLQLAAGHIKKFIADGYNPIIFCRFIPTAEYLEKELKSLLPKDVVIMAVTGNLPPADRETRVLELSKNSKRVLVCTDCLSEGVNLQDNFDAVMHYDLSWNPTRHEQREGRVDRYGQKNSSVRVLTYYGADNPIDGIVLEVLIKKHKKIKTSLGISVPVPLNSESLVEAIFEGLLLRKTETSDQLFLPGLEEFLKPSTEKFAKEWEGSAEREKRSRTVFAQETIKVDEVARELNDAWEQMGTRDDAREFLVGALKSSRAIVIDKQKFLNIDMRETTRALRDHLQIDDNAINIGFEYPAPKNVTYVTRTHPFIEGLATYVMDASLDKLSDSIARRAGAIRTKAVSQRTTVLLVRFRYDITTKKGARETSNLIEECAMIGFRGAAAKAEWLAKDEVEALLAALPAQNITPEQAADFIENVESNFSRLIPQIEKEGHERAEKLLISHRRLRDEANIKGVTYKISPKLPADILGIYLYLPALAL
jgi:superfamily II DNA or RNA helicase